jgi:hypothetical protein
LNAKTAVKDETQKVHWTTYLSSSLYMSPITPLPTDSPAEDPIACRNRRTMSSGTPLDKATPRDPAHSRGKDTRYMGLRPSSRYGWVTRKLKESER